MHMVVLLCRLYGEKYCSRFLDSWIPLAHTLVITGKKFNCGILLSNQLGLIIEKFHHVKQALGIVPTFYMPSYFLDGICASNVFLRLSLIWHTIEAHVHVYFQALSKHKYKQRQSEICNHFLARLYYTIFREECPRLSTNKKRFINHIGN
jgi:hypothetical protein